MTTDEALARLREDWGLSRASHHLTDDPGWAVDALMNGEFYERLGWGATVADAIEAAEAKAAQNEREQVERRADYARRKAAGQLTALEMVNEQVGTLWSADVWAAVNTPSILLSRVDRSYEGEVARTGDTIEIRKWPR